MRRLSISGRDTSVVKGLPNDIDACHLAVRGEQPLCNRARNESPIGRLSTILTGTILGLVREKDTSSAV